MPQARWSSWNETYQARASIPVRARLTERRAPLPRLRDARSASLPPTSPDRQSPIGPTRRSDRRQRVPVWRILLVHGASAAVEARRSPRPGRYGSVSIPKSNRRPGSFESSLQKCLIFLIFSSDNTISSEIVSVHERRIGRVIRTSVHQRDVRINYVPLPNQGKASPTSQVSPAVRRRRELPNLIIRLRREPEFEAVLKRIDGDCAFGGSVR